MNSPGPSSGKITPLQQMLASGSGALITSLLGKTFAYVCCGKCLSLIFAHLRLLNVTLLLRTKLPDT